MSEDSEQDDEEEAARLHYRHIIARSPINRVRCMHQQPGIVATWGENGIVTVLNASAAVSELAEEDRPRSKGSNNALQVGSCVCTACCKRFHAARQWLLTEWPASCVAEAMPCAMVPVMPSGTASG